MTPSEREHYRWKFAGWAMTQLRWPEGISYRLMAQTAMHVANAIIAELEETAPDRAQVEIRETWDKAGNKTVSCAACDSVLHPCEHEAMIWRIDANGRHLKCSKCDKHLYTERLS